MAFGKDSSQLGNVGNYRQMAMTQVHRGNGGGNRGGGGGMPTFVDRFKPSTTEEDFIRLVAGNFTIISAVDKENTVQRVLPFMTFTEHFDGQTKQSCTCSAGPFAHMKDKKQPCRGCDMFWEFKKPDGKPGARMSKRDMFAFSIIHYAPYAHVPQLDRRTGQVRTNSEGKPFMEWKRVYRHEKAQYDGYEQKTAHRLHWPMGTEHYGVLWEYDDKIGQSCSACSGVKTITPISWNCSNPDCGEEIIDMESTTLPPEEIKKITFSEDTTCPRCRTKGFLKEIVSCKNCTPIGREPKRATLFDVDMHVQRKPANDGSDKTALLVTGWSEPRPIEAQYAELAKPLMLDKIYAPTPWDKQVEKFGPPTSMPARTPVNGGTVPYGNR
jgi:hypothetical protein